MMRNMQRIKQIETRISDMSKPFSYPLPIQYCPDHQTREEIDQLGLADRTSYQNSFGPCVLLPYEDGICPSCNPSNKVILT
jgi:hypothetical protein